jgi:NDP-sugar pyrophosphorylase family protein
VTARGDLIPAVILAGGLATRLRPLTQDFPKALVEVAGKPFLWHQLRLLRRNGIREVVLLTGYKGELIRDRFGNGAEVDVSLTYREDGPQLLGTAGAIRNALDLLPQRFFVLYGDSYLTCDYSDVQEAFLRCRLPALMTVYRNENRHDTSNVEFDGERILRYDKRNRTPAMSFIDYGLSAFEKDVFSAVPAGVKIDLETVFQDLLAAGRLGALEVKQRFYEIGSPEGLRETADFLLARG